MTITATYTVQADFSGTAFGGTPTWTDITSYVLTTGEGSPISITFGRQDEHSDVSPSQLSLVLINDDSRFTPGNTSGAYYPRVLPGVRLRVSEVVNGVTYYRFDGYVDSWEVHISPAKSSLCSVAATDVVGWMGTLAPLRSAVIEEMLLDSPTALYPLDEPEGAASAADLTGQNAAAVVTNSKYGAGSITFGADVTASALSGAVTFVSPDAGLAGPSKRGTYMALPNVLPATKPFTIEVWFQTSAIPFDTEALVTANTLDQFGAGQVYIDVVSSGNLQGHINSGGAVLTVDGTVSVCDGAWHHAALTLESDGKTLNLYQDGALVSTAADVVDIGWEPMSTQPITLGMAVNAIAGFYAAAFSGTMSTVGIYPTALSAPRILAHYNAGKTAFAGEATSARIARLLSYRPNIGSVLATGDGTVAPADINGVTLQQALFDVAKAEGGVIYADGQGRIVFLNRSGRYDAVSSFTLNASSNQVSADTTFRVDAQGLVNDVTITRPNGAGGRATDATSQATYGIRAVSDTLMVNSDRDAADAAGWRLATSKTPAPQSPNTVVDLATETSNATAQAVLAAIPGTRMTLSNLPSSAPASTMDATVQGWAESIGRDQWTVSFFTTQVPPTTLRADATADTYTLLDAGNVIGW